MTTGLNVRIVRSNQNSQSDWFRRLIIGLVATLAVVNVSAGVLMLGSWANSQFEVHEALLHDWASGRAELEAAREPVPF